MDRNERGEEMHQPKENTVQVKFVVFAPDGMPMLQTIATTKEDAKQMAIESMQQGFAGSWPDWEKLEKWGANVKRVIVTIKIDG